MQRFVNAALNLFLQSPSESSTTSRNTPCSYPSCSSWIDLQHCSECLENIPQSYCPDHLDHTQYADHRNLPVFKYEENEIALYEAYKENQMTSKDLKYNPKKTKFILELLTNDPNVSTRIHVTNIEYGHTFTAPKSLNPLAKSTDNFREELQCFWISLGFHLEKWPYVLKYEAICRMKQIIRCLKHLYLVEDSEEEILHGDKKVFKFHNILNIF